MAASRHLGIAADLIKVAGRQSDTLYSKGTVALIITHGEGDEHADHVSNYEVIIN